MAKAPANPDPAPAPAQVPARAGSGAPVASPARKKYRFHDENVADGRREVEAILAARGLRAIDLFPPARRPGAGSAARPCGCGGPPRAAVGDDPGPSPGGTDLGEMCDGPDGGVFVCGPDGPEVVVPPATGGPWVSVWDNTTNSRRWMDLGGV